MNNQSFSAPKPHLPKELPLDLKKLFTDEETIQLLTKASIALGTYRGFLSSIINPMLLISPIVNQEAVLSSKLEGTHATLEDVLNFEAGNKVEIESDEIQEIINYRKSLFYAIEEIGTINSTEKGKLPLSTRIIKEMHRILLNNVRGSSKRPGQFKVFQNYIGGVSSISHTPVPPELTDHYMQNLEYYIHYDDFDLIIQSAIVHAQFEMIHPFEDGNGRIGRLLIPLFLYYRELLPYPTFYMSSYFETDRSLYISYLSNISKKNDWKSWIDYYLKGVIFSAENSTEKAKSILSLYDYMKSEIIPSLNSASGIDLLDFIFSAPIFSAKQASDHLTHISDRTVYTLLNKLSESNFLSSNEAKRNKTYYCPQLLSIMN